MCEGQGKGGGGVRQWGGGPRLLIPDEILNERAGNGKEGGSVARVTEGGGNQSHLDSEISGPRGSKRFKEFWRLLGFLPNSIGNWQFGKVENGTAATKGIGNAGKWNLGIRETEYRNAEIW